MTADWLLLGVEAEKNRSVAFTGHQDYDGRADGILRAVVYLRVTFEPDLNAVFDLRCYIASENGQKRSNFGGFLISATVGRICD